MERLLSRPCSMFGLSLYASLCSRAVFWTIGSFAVRSDSRSRRVGVQGLVLLRFSFTALRDLGSCHPLARAP